MTVVTTTPYIRKPLYVDAVRVTAGNFDAIAAWCQGEVHKETEPGPRIGKNYIRVRVINPTHPRQTKAFVGDWVLYTERGYKVYTNKMFHQSFDEVVQLEVKEEVPSTLPVSSYPYDEGDVTVLGPECFAAQDGSVLSWKGANYVLQDESNLTAENTSEEIKAA